jgi:hypothetical protein
MSTPGELYADAMREEWFAQMYLEHAEQAQAEFKSERLRSYYAAHLDVAELAVGALSDGRGLRSVSLAASLIRATTGIELGLKNLLLRPIVYGLVHSESLASAITEMVMPHQALDRYRDLLIGILNEHSGVDLKTFSRVGASETLLTEVFRNQKTRNDAVHKGVVPTGQQCDDAIAIGRAIIEDLFPQIVGRLGFHQHGALLCDDPHISEQLAATLEQIIQ